MTDLVMGEELRRLMARALEELADENERRTGPKDNAGHRAWYRRVARALRDNKLIVTARSGENW